MVFRGFLVPDKQVNKLITVYEKRIAEKIEEASIWKAAWEASQESNRLLIEHNGKLLEVGRTTEQILKPLQGISPQKELPSDVGT